MRHAKQLGFVFVCSVVAIKAVMAHGGATGIVKERMDAMGVISDNMKLIGQMLKGQQEYSLSEIAAAASRIADHSGKEITRLFPEGSTNSPSEAKPEIWLDWQTFGNEAKELKLTAEALSDVANAGADKKEVAIAFGALANTCKTCHEQFRLKK